LIRLFDRKNGKSSKRNLAESKVAIVPRGASRSGNAIALDLAPIAASIVDRLSENPTATGRWWTALPAHTQVKPRTPRRPRAAPAGRQNANNSH
jgi:hypothetical protein